ncbi:hypothetical protein C5167_015030 [Papaver somniferum]|uniref:Uncharacterized protein n=1 Tax=Papaver somniferum TaxID=3469 RepID=A0A4Y7J8W7_PAPSO|nr:hypothetical protein C5167_015030 [Papaver somniferum]
MTAPAPDVGWPPVCSSFISLIWRVKASLTPNGLHLNQKPCQCTYMTNHNRSSAGSLYGKLGP